MQFVFFKSIKHFPVLPIANSCPAVPAAASRVAMSTEAVVILCVRGNALVSWGPQASNRGVCMCLADADP